MKPEIFTEPWAQAWGEELNRSETYRAAAAGWEGPIALVLEADETVGVREDRPVLLDLWHGHCRAARAAVDGDLEAAPFVLTAPAAVWRRVLAGELEPLFAVMAGKLRLARGSVAKLLPYATASKEMVASARRLDASYPAGWEAP